MKFSIYNFQFTIFRPRRGITLIEVLVTAGLTSVITVLIVGALLNALQSSDNNYSKYKISSNLDSVINDISQYSLLSLSMPATFIHNDTTYTNDTDTLILQIPAISPTGSVISGYFDSIVYDFDSNTNKLNELIVPSNQSSRNFKSKTIATDVETVAFTQTDSSKGKVENINLTVDSSSFGKTSRFSLSKSVRMRNQE